MTPSFTWREGCARATALLLVAALALLTMGAAQAQEERRGFLFEIRKGGQASLLFGTIHVGRADFYPLPASRMTRLARSRYYDPYVIRHNGWESKAKLTAHRLVDEALTADTDVYTLIKDGLVAVTPLSLDVTSRVKLDELDQLLRK